MKISVHSDSVSRLRRWIEELGLVLAPVEKLEIQAWDKKEDLGIALLVDAASRDAAQVLEQARDWECVIVLVVDEKAGGLPRELLDGRADDIWVWPFRPLEIQGKLLKLEESLAWRKVSQLNFELSRVVDQLKSDLALAERLQTLRQPSRYPSLKGIKVFHRYLAGNRPGGDFFDVVDSKSGQNVSAVLSDASSYGLPSAVLSAMMMIAVKLATESQIAIEETVRNIHHEIGAALGAKDRLSLFFGTLSRRDLRFRYLSLGSVRAFRSPMGEHEWVSLPGVEDAIRADHLPEMKEAEVRLTPGERILILSDGFMDVLGNDPKTWGAGLGPSAGDPKKWMNELAFRVKKQLEDGEELPAQDCTALVIEVDPKAIRIV